MNKKEKKVRRILFCALSILFLSNTAVMAADPGTILSTSMEEGKVVLYVQSPGDIEEIQCQIGTYSCQEVRYEPIHEQELPVETLFLLDNSLSVAQEYRPVINEVMNNLAANRMPGELITVATFSDTITYLLEASDDFTQLKQVIDGITYEDQETYLTDVLYELLNSWSKDGKSVFRRIVIVSDGVDNKAIGYTKEELVALLEEHPLPIYTLGCTSGNGKNSDELENMFALSRMTQASYWLLDEVEDTLSIASEVAGSNDVWKVTITPPPEVCDGTKKGIKLNMRAAGTETETSTVVEMPFVIAEEEDEKKEPASTGVIDTEYGTRIDVSANSKESDKQKETLLLFGIAGGTVLIIVIVVILIAVIRRNKKRNAFVTVPEKDYREILQNQENGNVTEIIQPEQNGSGNTVMVWGNNNASRILILIDQGNQRRRFEVPMTGTIIIGRSSKDGCHVVFDYEPSVSRKHCQIRLDGSQLMVKDLNSGNGTVINGKKIVGETVISSGSILRLGNLQIKVELH